MSEGLEVYYKGPIRVDSCFLLSFKQEEYLLITSAANQSLDFSIFHCKRKEKLATKTKSYPKFVRTIVRPVFGHWFLSIENSYNDFHLCCLYKLTSKGIQKYLKIIVKISVPYSIFSLDKHKNIVFSDGYQVCLYNIKQRDTIQTLSLPGSIDLQGMRYSEKLDALFVIGREMIFIREIKPDGTIGDIKHRIEPFANNSCFSCFVFYKEQYLFTILEPQHSSYQDENLCMGTLFVSDINSAKWVEKQNEPWVILGEPYLSAFPEADRICVKTMNSVAIYKLSDKSLVSEIQSPGYFLTSSKKRPTMFFNKGDCILSLTISV